MQFRNKALAGAVMIALVGCAHQEKKQQTVSQNDQLQQQRAQLAYEQQLAYKNNIAGKQAAGQACDKQAPGQAAPAELAPPSCNCSCSPEGSKSSVTSGKVKASSMSKKGAAAESLTDTE